MPDAKVDDEIDIGHNLFDPQRGCSHNIDSAKMVFLEWIDKNDNTGQLLQVADKIDNAR